jgi:recombination protein RecR
VTGYNTNMNIIDELTEIFKEFPGIGPRQARRFVYHLLRKNDFYVNKIVELIPELRKSTKTCKRCFRYFSSNSDVCDICANKNRDGKVLMVVSRDSDLENIERTDTFNGYYFVLGGLLPVLEKDSTKFLRLDELQELINKSEELEEVVLAFPVNPEGDNTAEFISKKLKARSEKLKITLLGRGLSTGLELEYSDKETIKNALENRH